MYVLIFTDYISLSFTDRRRSHVIGSAPRIARNRRRTGRIGSPAGYFPNRVKSNTKDRRPIIGDRHT